MQWLGFILALSPVSILCANIQSLHEVKPYVVFYDEKFTPETGNKWTVRLGENDCGCNALPVDAQTKVSSLNNYGNCLILFWTADCTKAALRIDPYTYGYNDLSKLGFWENSVRAFTKCNCDTNGFEVTTTARSY